MHVAKNNDCLYFTVLFHGQWDIPQFTGQHTRHSQSRVTVLLNPENSTRIHSKPVVPNWWVATQKWVFNGSPDSDWEKKSSEK